MNKIFIVINAIIKLFLEPMDNIQAEEKLRNVFSN